MSDYKNVIQTEMPDIYGLWFYSCEENGNNFEACAIIPSNNGVYVEEKGLGITPLEDFHNGLTDLIWKK